MNLDQAAVVLRPRTTLEGVDLAVRFVVALDRRLYLRLAAVTLGPALGLSMLARVWAELDWFDVWTITLLLGTVAQGVFTIAAGRRMFSEEIRARDVVRAFVRRLRAYLGGLFLTRIVIVLGALVVFLLPVAWGRMAFVHEAVLLEGASAMEGSRRSSRFVKHHIRTAIEMLFAIVGIQVACIAAAESLGHGLVEFVLQLGRPVGGLLDEGGSLYALAGYYASLPLAATARFLTYIDSRTRRDGWDIQVRFASIEANEESRIR